MNESLNQIFLWFILRYRAFIYLGDDISRLLPWSVPPHPSFSGSRTNSKSLGSSTAVYSIHNWLDMLVMLLGCTLPQNLPISGESGPPFLRNKHIEEFGRRVILKLEVSEWFGITPVLFNGHLLWCILEDFRRLLFVKYRYVDKTLFLVLISLIQISHFN